ncbi:MAG: ATP-binding cassette domain-containing protein [Caulobacter sp.]|jgi:phospholipid/cholesterol/gamma-HCH transport system ATP-binding protein|nr:ATP-binding cassette domain-containing protein [Caulobacter sp.]
MSAGAPELEWRGVRKILGGRPVLDGLDLSLDAGRSLVIIGGSGQGKSVALKLALGLMRPDAGTVLFKGQSLPGLFNRRQSDLYRQSGVLFQGAALFDSLRVWEVVSFRLLYADNRPPALARDAAIEALAQVQLGPEVADLFPSELSGGMQKRVGLARAIVGAPRILFFDEPTTGLDPVTAASISRLIADQVMRLGCTAVTITHDLVSARTIADDIALLDGGRIAWQGGRADLDMTKDPRVRSMVEASMPTR